MSAERPAPDVTIVAPLFLTETFLDELSRRTAVALGARGLSHELILVDDCSPGRDLEVACRLADGDRRVGVIGLSCNVGQNLAGLIGMGHGRGRWTVLMDADLQDPPERIPHLIDRAARGFDAVFAGRRGAYESWHRRLSSRLYKQIQARVCGVASDAGLFVVTSRRLVERLTGDLYMQSRLIPLIGLTGLPTTSLPITRSPRDRGRSAYSSLHRARLGAANLSFALRWRLGWNSSFARLPDELVTLRAGCCRNNRG